jgi:hypothetical protein
MFGLIKYISIIRCLGLVFFLITRFIRDSNAGALISQYLLHELLALLAERQAAWGKGCW